MTSDQNQLSPREEVLRKLLRPIIQFCIRRSYSMQDLTHIAKIVFVEAAEDEIIREGGKVNASRLSVLTGIRRVDVTNIHRRNPQDRKKDPQTVSSRIVLQWRHDQSFTTKAGKPRVLTYKTDDSEFADLVRQVSTHIHPGAALYDLQRLGYVEETPRGVRLVKQLYTTRGDLQKAFEIASDDMTSLIDAVDETFYEDPEVNNLHIRTVYDNIIVESLPKIRKWMIREGKEFHKKARDFLSQFDKDINRELEGKDGGAEVSLTAFSYTPLTDEMKKPEE
ncbi:MAG: hypothetical protein KDD55_00320 [Bdellovibrionales bacterium]|nr:hypothetical protein [Bdellovibrionales bacterium]